MKQKYTITVADMELNIISDASPDEVENIVGILDRRMRDINLKSPRCTKNEAAILCALSYFSERAREAGGGSFTLPFTRQELADYLCVDRSAMTVALMDLKREGWIELAGRSVRLCKKDE